MTPVELRKWRKRQQLTQGSLAGRLGLHINTVHRWESGEVTIPPFLGLALETLERRASAPDRQPVQRVALRAQAAS
jgi:transcriptional regulator with XRE-family HTH domain